jgi:hypothetical protein
VCAQQDNAIYLSNNTKDASSKIGVRTPCGWQNFVPKHVAVTDDCDVVFAVFGLTTLVCFPRVLFPSDFLQPKRRVHFSSPLFVPIQPLIYIYIYFTGKR